MNARIRWIDWAKAVAVVTVVFCHLPQSQDWFYYRFLQSCVITVFFFVSGFLKRDTADGSVPWRRYWGALVLPYVLYNVAVYPWWLAKYVVLHGAAPGLAAALRPLAGAVLLEHGGSFAEPLNGPLWYLPAVLLMHLAVDGCRRCGRRFHLLMVLLCVLSVVLYAANKYWLFLPSLTPMGVFRRLPYYYMGYLAGHVVPSRRLSSLSCDGFQSRRWPGWLPGPGLLLPVAGLLLLGLSLLLFRCHLAEPVFLLHIALFYPVNISFLLGVLALCRWLGAAGCPRVVTRLSMGTLVVVGLHMPLVTAANAVVSRCRGLSSVPCYEWYEALPVSLLIVALLYVVVVWGLRHCPLLLGRYRGV